MISVKLNKRQSQETTEWSGGQTTQLYIYPNSASYSERNFDFRISSAVVSQEQSEFTSLPGYRRHIMLLDGSMNLVHENHHSRTLERYEQDFFDGAWHTSSQGKCTDFNLMLGSGFEGSLRCLYRPEAIVCKMQFCGLYALAEGLRVYVVEGSEVIFTEILNLNDFLMICGANTHPDCYVVLEPQLGSATTEALAVCASISAQHS